MKKKTHEEYVDEAFIKNPNIEVVGEYINLNTKIKHKCKVCGNEWDAYPSNILNGHGCPKCGNNKRSASLSFTREEYINKISYINPNIELIGDYKNANVKVLHRCKICGNEWMPYPSNILSGKGCMKCFSKKNADIRRKTQNTYIKQVNEINKDIEVVGDYIGAKIPIKHKCKICAYEWNSSPDSILHNHGCPKCIESNGEKKVREYLQDRSIEFVYQYTFDDCKYKKKLPFDFYIPKFNICIEYDGIQHYELVDYFGGYENFMQIQIRDQIKNAYCSNHNIQLIRIKYDESVVEVLDSAFVLQQ